MKVNFLRCHHGVNCNGWIAILKKKEEIIPSDSIDVSCVDAKDFFLELNRP